MSSTNSSKKHALALKRYLSYMSRRIKYIESGVLLVEPNELKFYKALYAKILSWGDNNKVIFLSLTHMLDRETAMKYLSLPYDRAYYRYAYRVREKLYRQIMQ